MSALLASARRAIPVCEWPQADQAAWGLANQPQDPLDDTIGYAQRWRPATRKLTQEGYGYWLNWLARSGQLGTSENAVTRVTPDRLRAYQQAMQAEGLAPYTVATRIQQVGNALRAIAPEGDWTWLLTAASRLRSKATPARDKRIGMQPAGDIAKLGHDMMQAAEHDRFRTKVERAVLFRDGLLLSMLVARPLRRANITGIEIGRHLQQRGEHWRMCFTAAEMKAPRPFECSVPVELESHIQHYIDIHRPTLLACSQKALEPSNALWISKQGTHMTSSAVSFQIKSRTEEEFGKPVNLQKFRHIYATDTATLTPAQAGNIKLALGHASQKVSEDYYNLAQMVDAGKAYDKTIDILRKESRSTRSVFPLRPDHGS